MKTIEEVKDALAAYRYVLAEDKKKVERWKEFEEKGYGTKERFEYAVKEDETVIQTLEWILNQYDHKDDRKMGCVIDNYTYFVKNLEAIKKQRLQ